jgi:hypothetical protein
VFCTLNPILEATLFLDACFCGGLTFAGVFDGDIEGGLIDVFSYKNYQYKYFFLPVLYGAFFWLLLAGLILVFALEHIW